MRLEINITDEQQNVKTPAWADIVKNADGVFELELIAVHDQYRNLGYGQKMFEKILSWMGANKIKQVQFLNSNPDFWSEMKKKFPRNIWLSNNMDGFIRT